MDKALLILADGTIFEGKAMGATGSTIGETVFTTGMTGYLETLTDPSYYGQIVTQTFPLIGNYGNIPVDYESKKSWVRGYIVRELCDQPSNFRCSGQLNDFLKAQGIIGICGIDTRALTKRLRESGVMNGMIISGKNADKFKATEVLEKIKDYKIEHAIERVQINPFDNGNAGDIRHAELVSASINKIPKQVRNDGYFPHVVLFDFGAKLNIQRELEKMRKIILIN